MVILILLAVVAFAVAAYYFLKGIGMLLKAAYYYWFASERQLDEGYKKHVLAEEPDYKKFESDFDKNIDSILNKENRYL